MTERRRTLKMEHLVVFIAVLVGLITGTERLADNSMLVHLTTGIGILNTGHVPHADPYSFTAHGDPWVVQSWLPEVIYGGLWKVGGGHLFIAFEMLLYAFIAGVLAALSRTGNWIRTGLVTFVAIGFGIGQWSPRPTGFGFLFLLLTVAVVQRRRSSLWLFPIGLLWVNSHGTWVLGLVWIIALGMGALLDNAKIEALVRYFATLAAGVLVGGLLSPAGWRILTFPLVPFGNRAAAFRIIVEWQSPNFRSSEFTSGLLIVIVLLITLVVLWRGSPTWMEIMPAVIFLGAALTGLRNLPLLGIVVTPTLARLLHKPAGDVAPVGKRLYVTSSAGGLGWGVLAVLIFIGAFEGVSIFGRPGFNFTAYPVDGARYLAANNLSGPGRRVYAPDYVGCYLVYLHGTKANVFIDDRYDMYPAQVETDAIHLGALADDTQAILHKYNFDALLLPRSGKLTQYIAVNPAWNQTWGDKNWVIYQPRGAALTA